MLAASYECHSQLGNIADRIVRGATILRLRVHTRGEGMA